MARTHRAGKETKRPIPVHTHHGPAIGAESSGNSEDNQIYGFIRYRAGKRVVISDRVIYALKKLKEQNEIIEKFNWKDARKTLYQKVKV